MHARAANLYRRVDLDSAPKHDVLARLYDRLLADLDLAKRAIMTRDIETKAKAIDHALRIVGEFQAALDHAAAPEMCANLSALYGFVLERIGHANLAMDPSAVDDATRIVAQLASAFRELR